MSRVLQLGRLNGRGGEAHELSSWPGRFYKALHRQPLEQAWQARSAVIAARESRDGGDAEVAAARN
jgi:hypothetical protein